MSEVEADPPPGSLDENEALADMLSEARGPSKAAPRFLISNR